MNAAKKSDDGDEPRSADPPAGPLAPLLVDSAGAARLLGGISRSHFAGLHAGGRLPLPIRLGRRVMWSVGELERWVQVGCPSRERWEAMREAEA